MQHGSNLLVIEMSEYHRKLNVWKWICGIADCHRTHYFSLATLTGRSGLTLLTKPSALFRFRLRCHWLCNHPYFGNLVLLCILVSSVMLAAEDPLNSNSERNKVSTTRDWVNFGEYNFCIFRFWIILIISSQQSSP